jgi:putative DNA methylase
MMEAGILASKGGNVRLLRPDELSADWDPTKDKRLTAWEMVHQIIHALEAGGESAAEALSYNGLVQNWPEITRLAREEKKSVPVQLGLFGQD